MPSVKMPRSGWCLLGKHPSRPDFVRLNLSSEAGVELHRWLEQGVELLHRQRQPLALRPTRFLYVPQRGEVALWGAMVPSQDSLGRAFPLAAFLELELAELPPLSHLPHYAVEAMDDAQRFLAECAGAQAPAGVGLEARLEAVAKPPPDAKAQARLRAEELLATVKVSDFQALFEDGPTVGGAWYAVKTVRSAFDTRHKVAGPPPTLECRLGAHFGVAAWLAVVAQAAGAAAPRPSLLWNDELLYAALGEVPAAVFPGLVGAPATSSRIWPTVTDQQGAIDSARASLQTRARLAEPDLGLLDALSALGAQR